MWKRTLFRWQTFLLLNVIFAFPLLGNAAPAFKRPIPDGGGPTLIRCTIAVLDLDDISDANQNFTVNIFAQFEWIDPREEHREDGHITKDLEDVWYPHLFFINMQKTWSNLDGTVKIAPDGNVVFRRQLWGDFSQPMNLHDFPFDQQTFEIRMVATGLEEDGDIKLIQNPDDASFITDTYSVADWKILNSEVSLAPYQLPTGDQEVSYAFRFTAKRLSHFHVIKNIAPLLMIVMLSWLVFWLDPKDGGSQLAVAVTAFLTLIAFHAALNARLPEISYLTRFDIFVFGVNLLVLLAMIEVVITTGMARTQRCELALRLDRICRVIFPSALVIVAMYAFVWR